MQKRLIIYRLRVGMYPYFSSTRDFGLEYLKLVDESTIQSGNRYWTRLETEKPITTATLPTLNPCGMPSFLHSPVQNCLKFSAVFGQTSENSSRRILPSGVEPTSTSRKTTGLCGWRREAAIWDHVELVGAEEEVEVDMAKT